MTSYNVEYKAGEKKEIHLVVIYRQKGMEEETLGLCVIR